MEDIKEIKGSVNIIDIIGRYVELRKRGTEFYGICPFHNDSKASLQVNERKQIFKCFPCGAAGDVVSFLTKQGKTLKQALEELKNPYYVTSPTIYKRVELESEKNVWNDCSPSGPPAEIRHYKFGVPSKTWAYRNTSGDVIGYACRFEVEGEKQVLPFTYKTNGSEKKWTWMGFDKPRPLYNLHKIVQNPEKSILIVEGEKTADAASKLIPSVIATAWMGGASAVKYIDLTPLQGRVIVLWPDNDYTHAYKDGPMSEQIKPFHDQPGNKAMLEIANALKPYCRTIKWVNNPKDSPCGWDIADADWTPKEAIKYIKENMVNVPYHNPEKDPLSKPIRFVEW